MNEHRPPRPPCTNHAPHPAHLLYRNPDQECAGVPAPAPVAAQQPTEDETSGPIYLWATGSTCPPHHGLRGGSRCPNCGTAVYPAPTSGTEGLTECPLCGHDQHTVALCESDTQPACNCPNGYTEGLTEAEAALPIPAGSEHFRHGYECGRDDALRLLAARADDQEQRLAEVWDEVLTYVVAALGHDYSLDGGSPYAVRQRERDVRKVQIIGDHNPYRRTR